MYTTSLRKVGGSIMLAVPPSILDLLQLHAGSVVGLTVDGEKLVIEPQPKPSYTLEELLAASDFSAARGQEDVEWVNGPATGKELL